MFQSGQAQLCYYRIRFKIAFIMTSYQLESTGNHQPSDSLHEYHVRRIQRLFRAHKSYQESSVALTGGSSFYEAANVTDD